MTKDITTFVLILDKSCSDTQKKFIRLPPPAGSYILEFILPTGTWNAQFRTNYPIKTNKFERDKMHNIDFIHHRAVDDWTASVEITLPGIYHYECDFDTADNTANKIFGAFLVEPRLYTPDADNNKNFLPLDAISIITVVPKWMPKIDDWMPHFTSLAKSGYNMVHFAPINTRGASNSPYSIYDQLDISLDLFDDEISVDQKWSKLNNMLESIFNQNGMLSVTDVVWNHMASNSIWLEEHPEAAYNLVNSPHLRPAAELDATLMQFSRTYCGGNCSITTDEELNQALTIFKERYYANLKLWEFYVIDKVSFINSFQQKWIDNCFDDVKNYSNINLCNLSLKEKADRLRKDALMDLNIGNRYSKTLDLEVACCFVSKLLSEKGSNIAVELARREIESILDEINLVFYQEFDTDSACIFEQVRNRAHYLRVAENGPKLGCLSEDEPLIDPYFTRLPINERTSCHHEDELILANNGWIWNADPLLNFASSESKSYLRREVIAWADCVKLRYGEKQEDSPWLWEHQAKYTRLMAKYFHGFRIDNCHSTPINVASYFLDLARSVNPDLYVIAELFTGSEEKDVLFVSKLGINSLIREAMSAWNPHELSRQVHRLGGKQPNGSFVSLPERFPPEMLGHWMKPSFFHSEPQKGSHRIYLKGSTPHSLFMDCTHDNETPNQKRTAEDTLPNAAIVAMSDCAIGSVKGYDELVPELLNVVLESRKYRIPDAFEGIIPAKAILNQLHQKMSKQGFNEIHVHQEGDFISIHRLNPISHSGYLLITRTAFGSDQSNIIHSPIMLREQVCDVFLSASLKVSSNRIPRQSFRVHANHSDGSEYGELISPSSPTLYYHPTSPDRQKGLLGGISGLPCSLGFSTSESNLCEVSNRPAGVIISINAEEFVPGSIVIYRTSLIGSAEERFSPILSSVQILWELLGFKDRNRAMSILNKIGQDFSIGMSSWFSNYDDLLWPSELKGYIGDLEMEDINIVLFRTAAEENDTIGTSTYFVPNYGELVYAGLQGVITPLLQVAQNNDLGHPICNNLREGKWLISFIIKRLDRYLGIRPKLKGFKTWLEERLDLVAKLPVSLVPKYFFLIIMLAYQGVRYRALEMSSGFKKFNSTSFENLLNSCRMASFQMYGNVASTTLFPGNYPKQKSLSNANGSTQSHPPNLACLAAGLPHFSTNHMRCWGRDVFISLSGFFLLSGRFNQAKAHIIAFGSALKHGLIPNLLDQGVKPRYNARDAAWWWLRAVADYCRLSEEGNAFLGVEVARRFVPLKRYTGGQDYGCDYDAESENVLADEYIEPSHQLTYSYTNTIAELCHEILDRHARGIHFREWNAGPNLDHAMSNNGFDIDINTMWENDVGFVRGGSRMNCGTWMDKMGDSNRAKTKGYPATPRDGADVEIIGLLKSALQWIVNDLIHKSPYWKWNHVTKDTGSIITYDDWNNMVQNSFEKYFYIPKDPELDKNYKIDSKLVNVRGIYKDVYGSSLEYSDYQLRPNICIAMLVAPELFTKSLAVEALKIVKSRLLGPMGIKTLDPSDWSYRGTYDNSNDSDDASVAHGFNYHQGPEWVWIACVFARAYVKFTNDPSPIWTWISNGDFSRHLSESYCGLPELTNAQGIFCPGSCPTQAWSCSTMIELLVDLEKYEF